MPHLEIRGSKQWESSIVIVFLSFGEVGESHFSRVVQLWEFLQVLEIKRVGICTPAEQSARLVLQEMRLLELMLVMTVRVRPCYCMF